MKKKILATALAGTLALSGGMLLAGCGGINQSKAHEVFRSANTAMLAYEGSRTYVNKEDGRLDDETTFNHLTGEYADISYNDEGDVSHYYATKYFDDSLAYLSSDGYSEQIVDIPYVEKEASYILRRAAKEIELDYSEYVKEANAEMNAFKQNIIEEGGQAYKVAYTINYTSLGNEKYNLRTYLTYDYQMVEEGEGSRVQYEMTSNIVFSEDWIHSQEETVSYKIMTYEGGVVVAEEKETARSVDEFYKTYDASIYAKLDLSQKTLPTEVEYTYLNLGLGGQIIREDMYVPFNVDIKEKIESVRAPEEGEEYEYYLDADCTVPMPDDYQLNSVEENTIYIKSILKEGYARLVEVYQDSTGIRGTETEIIKLGEEFELFNSYNYKEFNSSLLIDGVPVNASTETYTFTEGQSHTILYIAAHDVDKVTQYGITVYADEGFYIEEGTPSEQTLREFLESVGATCYGIPVTNENFVLEITSTDGCTTCTLDNTLAELEGNEYTIHAKAPAGCVFIENQALITTEEATEEGISITFKKDSMLYGMTNAFYYEYTQFQEGLLSDFTVEITENGDYITVKISGEFDSSLYYKFFFEHANYPKEA